jgi:ATPase family AAA domain-containing protein 1
VYYVVRYLTDKINFDPESEQKEQARRKSAAILRRLDEPIDSDGDTQDARRRPRKEDLVLSQYEQAIAMDVVAPDDIPVSFDDIGGLKDIIEELKESVIYPLTMNYSRSSSLLSAPSGVLLYGPPGCGKTMLAKALAHESGACFINLHISTLTEKWYGDSNKLVNAVFSLARKLEPTIVFIDEIDAVLGTRRSGEHEASGMVKAEFMTHWDGLTSANSKGLPQRVMILGATNRIQDIDEAILRRMPKKFPVSLPSASQRQKILKLVLKDTKIEQEKFDMEYLVKVMAGMSGSDIKEACRDAAMVPVREMFRRQRDSGKKTEADDDLDIRGIRTDDFFKRIGGVQTTKKSKQYHNKKGQDEAWSTESSAAEDDADMEDATEVQKS